MMDMGQKLFALILFSLPHLLLLLSPRRGGRGNRDASSSREVGGNRDASACPTSQAVRGRVAQLGMRTREWQQWGPACEWATTMWLPLSSPPDEPRAAWLGQAESFGTSPTPGTAGKAGAAGTGGGRRGQVCLWAPRGTEGGCPTALRA